MSEPAAQVLLFRRRLHALRRWLRVSACAQDGPSTEHAHQRRSRIEARRSSYGDDRHWTCGDRGVSEWTIRGTQRTGEHIEVRGCDVFEFIDGKISRKDSFWKIID